MSTILTLNLKLLVPKGKYWDKKQQQVLIEHVSNSDIARITHKNLIINKLQSAHLHHLHLTGQLYNIVELWTTDKKSKCCTIDIHVRAGNYLCQENR